MIKLPNYLKSTSLASVKLTIALLSMITLTILIGAWCPQKSQVGMSKVVEQFGKANAKLLDQYGITDIFHTNFFLLLIALLTVNLIACSFQRVFSKLKLYSKPLLFFNNNQISKMPIHQIDKFQIDDISKSDITSSEIINALSNKLKKNFYTVQTKDNLLNGHKYKFSKYAATVTHIGLLTLLIGVTITSWTGFSGIEAIGEKEFLTFGTAEHAQLWMGKIPNFKVRLNSTTKESYPTGQAKQWYSNLTVIKDGKEVMTKTISVNEPLSYDNVDIYQANWGLKSAKITFNGRPQFLNLQPMGNIWAAFLPLSSDTVLILSIKNQTDPLKLFAKRQDWQAPKLISQIPIKDSINLGGVEVGYQKVYPMSGLQYKSDPGLPITYIAFGFIILGVLLAIFPYSEIYVSISNNGNKLELALGGICPKSKHHFKILLHKLLNDITSEHNLKQSHYNEEKSLTYG